MPTRKREFVRQRESRLVVQRSFSWCTTKATRVLDEPARRRLSERAARAWPPGPHALATAASVAVGAYLNDTARLMTCFVGPDDSSGTRTRAAALPTRLGGSGVHVEDLGSLSPRERTAVDSALLL